MKSSEMIKPQPRKFSEQNLHRFSQITQSRARRVRTKDTAVSRLHRMLPRLDLRRQDARRTRTWRGTDAKRISNQPKTSVPSFPLLIRVICEICGSIPARLNRPPACHETGM
jgi:hypothetical protein